MYERLSHVAEKVVMRAEIFADELGQEYVGTEHLLLAMMVQDKQDTGQILTRFGLTATTLRTRVEQLIKEQLSDSFVVGTLPSTPHLQHVMANGVKWARRLKADAVGTRHLLLAVIEEEGSVGQAALEDLGVDLDKLKTDLTG